MVCEQLLNEVLPTMPGVPGAFWMRGYVWHGGFTIYRATPWANVMRAMGTGRFIEAGPLTRIDFRVGLGRYKAYGLALLALLFELSAWPPSPSCWYALQSTTPSSCRSSRSCSRWRWLSLRGASRDRTANDLKRLTAC